MALPVVLEPGLVAGLSALTILGSLASLTVAFFRCRKQTQKKCPRVVVSLRSEFQSASSLLTVFKAPLQPPTSGAPYVATTQPLGVPLRLSSYSNEIWVNLADLRAHYALGII